MKTGRIAYPILCAVGVFFFLYSSLPITLPSANTPQILYPSPQRNNLRALYAKSIKKATRSIYLSTYTLSDPTIISLLNEKGRAGVDIHIVTDKKTNPHLKKHLDPSIHLTLEKGPGLMHEKILVIDNELLLLGTANMTYSSLMIHDNLVLGLYDPLLAQNLAREGSSRQEMLQGTEGQMYLLPDHAGTHLETLQKMLLSAAKTVDIAMFTFTHPSLAETLETLSQKGVQVTCIIDKNSFRGKSRHLLTQLHASGAHLFTSTQRKLFHHKWALIDGQFLVIGSANWTQSAFNKNKDFFIITNLNKSNQNIIKNHFKHSVNYCNSY